MKLLWPDAPFNLKMSLKYVFRQVLLGSTTTCSDRPYRGSTPRVLSPCIGVAVPLPTF